VKVTLHSDHHSLTPSKQRSRVHALTGQHLRYIRSASFLWWMQQKLLSGVRSGIEGGRSSKLAVAEGRTYSAEARKRTLAVERLRIRDHLRGCPGRVQWDRD
jgi:hypothetical protein